MFPQQLEETILNLSEFHRSGAPFIVIGNVIDPSTDGVAPHGQRIERLQHFRDRLDVGHSRIEPFIIAVSVEDDRHSVVNWRSDRVRGCCGKLGTFLILAFCVVVLWAGSKVLDRLHKV